MKRILSKIKWKKAIKWLIIIAIIVVGGTFAFQQFSASRLKNSSAVETITTASVETRDIQNVLSSSGTIQPLNSYEVTTLVEGEVIVADFEEGDIVEEGQILYQIDTDSVDNKIDNTNTTLERAEKKLAKAEKSYSEAAADLTEAQSDYNDAEEKYGSPNYEVTETGIIKTLYVEEGDTVQAGTKIAEIYDNSYMLLTIPFPAGDADSSMVGKKASVIMEASDETLTGTVTKVSTINETLSGNRLVNQVTIKVENPGGITAAATATASIGSLYCSDAGTFTALTEKTLTSDVTGEIKSLKAAEGSKVKEGDILFVLTDKSVEDQLESYSNKLESAQDAVDTAEDNVESCKESIEDAQSELEDTIDTRADYSITAPISGRVISKNALVGDTISSLANTALCVIYDLSAVTFEMDVDELDVTSVNVGQKVKVTADAFEDQVFSGTVTNISLESISNQGVTQYPVTVRIDDAGDLLSGMNVTGKIITAEVKGVMAVPADALMRGDGVYVKDDTVKEANGDVPAGFRKVKVETGLTDGDYIEIKSGLSGDEEVYAEHIPESTAVMLPNMGPGMNSSQTINGSGSTMPGGNQGMPGMMQ